MTWRIIAQETPWCKSRIDGPVDRSDSKEDQSCGDPFRDQFRRWRPYCCPLGISRDLVEQGLNAGEWIREVAKIVDGKGGGKA